MDDREPDLDSEGWTDFHDTLRITVDSWLVNVAAGSAREMISLRQASLPPARIDSAPRERSRNDSLQFTISVCAVYDWSTDPKTLDGQYPRVVGTFTGTLEAAERATRKAYRRIVGDEIEAENDEHRPLGDLQYAFPVGGEDDIAVQFDRALDADGTIRLRAIYVTEYENIKITAWARPTNRSIH